MVNMGHLKESLSQSPQRIWVCKVRGKKCLVVCCERQGEAVLKSFHSHSEPTSHYREGLLNQESWPKKTLTYLNLLHNEKIQHLGEGNMGTG